VKLSPLSDDVLSLISKCRNPELGESDIVDSMSYPRESTEEEMRKDGIQ